MSGKAQPKKALPQSVPFKDTADISDVANPVGTVLNTGSGPQRAFGLHPAFRRLKWQEVRLDINPLVRPDLIGSITDMDAIAPDRSFDAVWSSHCIEHLRTHELPIALGEFYRVLKPDGFAIITCPDLEAVAQLVVDGRLEETAYVSPSGPITALDMMFGHTASVAAGNNFMSHQTGLTADRLGRLCLDAGFKEARVVRGTHFDLWAVVLKSEAARARLSTVLVGTDLEFLLHGDAMTR